MSHPTVVLLVRFRSPLSLEEVTTTLARRADEFRALEGLQQKYYLQDTTTGEYAGLYLWETPQALVKFRDSELRASIAEAYKVQGAPRVEMYRVMKTLRE